jgi:Mrp family chromosome partitioning ATPase
MIPVEVLPHLKVISMAFFIGDQDNPVVWRGPLKHSAISQFLGEVEWGPLDYLIVDLPPGTGDEPLSVAHLIKEVDGSIVVTTPQDVALLDSRKAVTFSHVIFSHRNHENERIDLPSLSKESPSKPAVGRRLLEI